MHKLGLVETQKEARRRRLQFGVRALACSLLGAVVFAIAFVWLAMALRSWDFVGQLFAAGFDIQAAFQLFLVAARDDTFTVAGAGALGAIVGAICGILVSVE